MDGEVSEQLDAIERAGQINRQQNQAALDSHLEAASLVVGELAALAVQGLLKRPDFTE